MNMTFSVGIPATRQDASLSALMPIDEPEHIRKLRRQLMTARDLATRGFCNPEAHTDQARSLFQVIVDVASAYVFRFQDLGDLEHAANLCLRLLNNAAHLDQLGGFNAQFHQ